MRNSKWKGCSASGEHHVARETKEKKQGSPEEEIEAAGSPYAAGVLLRGMALVRALGAAAGDGPCAWSRQVGIVGQLLALGVFYGAWSSDPGRCPFFAWRRR